MAFGGAGGRTGRVGGGQGGDHQGSGGDGAQDPGGDGRHGALPRKKAAAICRARFGACHQGQIPIRPHDPREDYWAAGVAVWQLKKVVWVADWVHSAPIHLRHKLLLTRMQKNRKTTQTTLSPGFSPTAPARPATTAPGNGRHQPTHPRVCSLDTFAKSARSRTPGRSSVQPASTPPGLTRSCGGGAQ